MPLSFPLPSRSVRFRAFAILFAGGLLFGATGCGDADRPPGAPRTVDRQVAAEAEGHAAEAAFAVQIRDFRRAEGAMQKAIALRDDIPDWWFSLGLIQMCLGRKDDARTAYRRALDLHESRYDETESTAEVIAQIYLLVVLNRESDARKRLEKASRQHRDDARLQEFIRTRGIDRLLADPEVRANQL